jgi:hypothetical protein
LSRRRPSFGFAAETVKYSMDRYSVQKRTKSIGNRWEERPRARPGALSRAAVAPRCIFLLKVSSRQPKALSARHVGCFGTGGSNPLLSAI